MHSCYPSVPDHDGSVSSAAAQRVVPPSSSSVTVPPLMESSFTLQDVDSNTLDELARVLDPGPGHDPTCECNVPFSLKTSAIRKEKRIYHRNTVHLLKSQILRLKRRVRAFEDDSEILKDYTVSILVEKEQVERDLANVRTHYSDELARAKQARLQLQQIEAELARSKNRFAEAERFILALVDLGLDLPILREAISTILSDGQSGEDALINAFQKSSLAKGTSRSKHLSPAADGLRTVDHYLSALDLTISARKELKEKAKVSQFWKMVAKTDPAHADIVTPSPSALDQIQTLSISAFNAPRSSVVDDLVAQLRGTLLEKQSGENQSGAQNLRDADPALPETPPLSSPAQEGTTVSQHTPPSKAFSFTADPEPHSSPASNGKEKRPGLSTSPSRSSRDLMARQSIVAHQSMQSFSAAARRLSDPNLSLKLPFPVEEAAKSKTSQTSDLDLDVHVLPPPTMQSASDTASDLSVLLSPSLRQMKAMSYPYSIPSPASHRNRQMEQLLGRSHDLSTGAFRACQALLSLERICSALSSSSLGSLDGTEEETGENGPQSPSIDSNSNSSAGAEIEGGVLSSGEVGGEEGACEFPDNGDITPIHNNVKAGDNPGPDQNTSCPPVDNNVPVRKTVKWALPASPNRGSTGSSHSNSAAVGASPFKNSSDSDSSSKVRPLAHGKVRPRSSSSPTPTTRKSAIQAAKSTLSKSSRILKPKPKVPAEPTTKLSSSSKTKPKSSSSAGGPPTAPTSPRSAKVAPRPTVPPRSPLRPTSPTIGQVVSLAPIFKPRGRSGSLIPQPASVVQSLVLRPTEVDEDVEEDQLKVTSLPRSSRSTNVRTYDFTKPVMPLKVVKKANSSEQSSRRASSSSSYSSSSFKSSTSSLEAVAAEVATGTKVEVSSAVSPPVSPTHRQRPRPSPLNFKKQKSLPRAEETLEQAKEETTDSSKIPASDASPLANPTVRHETTNTAKRSSIGQPPPKRHSSDPTHRLRSKKQYVVPPMRTSSLMTPKTLQTPVRRPQLGPLHPLRPQGVIDPRRQQQSQNPKPVAYSQSAPLPLPTPESSSEKGEGVAVSGKQVEETDVVATSSAALPDPATDSSYSSSYSSTSSSSASSVYLSAGTSMTSPRSPALLSPPLTPVASAHKSFPTPMSSPKASTTLRIETPNATSPLAKLRLTILPPTTLARTLSTSKKADGSRGRQGGVGEGPGGRAVRERRSSMQKKL